MQTYLRTSYQQFMDEPVYNRELIAAVENLKDKKVIRLDADIVRKTGFSKGVVSGYLSGKVQASKNFLKKFDEIFGFDLRSEVLRNENPLKIGKLGNIVRDAYEGFILAKPVPFFDVDVSASDVEMYDDKREIPIEGISVKGIDDCDFAVPVFGSSMYPTYENGTTIFCKKIRDIEIIQFGEVHLIVTDDRRFVKRILKGTTKKNITCASDNTEARDRNGKRRYENFEIPKDKIRSLYIVKGSFKRHQL